MPLVYNQLRRLARDYLRRRARPHRETAFGSGFLNEVADRLDHSAITELVQEFIERNSRGVKGGCHPERRNGIPLHVARISPGFHHFAALALDDNCVLSRTIGSQDAVNFHDGDAAGVVFAAHDRGVIAVW